VQDDGSVFIEGAARLVNDCAPDAKGVELLSSGTFDILNGDRGYQVALKVRTNLPATFSQADVGQAKTQSPNFPNYGATDNNIIVFRDASVALSFIGDKDTADDAKKPGVDFACDTEFACSKADAEVLVSGTVFNVQTALSTEALVFLEAISADQAAILKDLFEDTLDESSKRQRIVAEMRVTGVTTGSGDLRPVTSFPFPLGIDLCAGCLAPDQGFCETIEDAADTNSNQIFARVAPVVGGEACFEGQEVASTECRCFKKGRAASGTSPAVPETDLGPANNDSCG
jgi:hypothetical protein